MELRPTADRLRETLFNILTAGNPGALDGSIWLDLYAGTGAVGIEALSRGAAQVYFVESSAKAAALIRANLKSLGAEPKTVILEQPVQSALRNLQTEVAGYIFLDPPYRLEEEYIRTLNALASSLLVHTKTVVLAEHHKKFDPGETIGSLRRYRHLVQGDAALSFYRKV
jgi:16S rRNA (guanine(966)-N(2))-methyltransferase RsmD